MLLCIGVVYAKMNTLFPTPIIMMGFIVTIWSATVCTLSG
ncbi:hypothetical protein SALWKB12_1740 [Snodgrassella communis]|uniref:Uncharacterized protein n=1 Tax=Snodgrassella communis TaxID=2946699 RepID=A0A836MR94_9NEIS|nr:hypothetical protein SALWKB12_1740 [Snodgrassella communis]KDN14682.1 hypothetical protein SALWKB29_1141 [Snodgrassella communis]